MKIKDVLEKYNLTVKQLSDRFGIPYRTVQNWCGSGSNYRECPTYLVNMIIEILDKDA